MQYGDGAFIYLLGAAGKPLNFGRGRWLDLEGGGIVSATPSAHAALIKAIAQAGEEANDPG